MPGSSVARVVRLALHTVLVVVASLPGLVVAGHASRPTAPADAFATAPASRAAGGATATTTSSTTSIATASAARPSSAAQLAGSGTTAASVLPGPLPARFGVVQPVPKASWIPNGQVNALASDGTYVYLGGSFTAMTDPKTGLSQAHAGLARVNLATGVSDGGWNPSVVGIVDALALRTSTNTLYVGGLFSTVNGQVRANFATVSSTGTGVLGSMNPAPDDEVRALLLDGSKLVVGGVFTTITGAAQHRLARLDATTGALDGGFAPNVSGGGVFAITRPTGANVYAIGGGFTLIGNNPHNFIGLVNAGTGAANSWTPSTVCPPGIKCQALSLASDGTRVYAAIAGPGGQTAAYDLSSGQRLWVVASDGNAQAVALYGGELFVGGHFNTSFGGLLRRTLAAVDARTGAVDPNFRPSATSTFPGTEALLATPLGVVAGGAQLAIAGTAQSRLAIFAPTTVAPTVKKVGGTGSSSYEVRRSLGSMR